MQERESAEEREPPPKHLEVHLWGEFKKKKKKEEKKQYVLSARHWTYQNFHYRELYDFLDSWSRI